MRIFLLPLGVVTVTTLIILLQLCVVCVFPLVCLVTRVHGVFNVRNVLMRAVHTEARQAVLSSLNKCGLGSTGKKLCFTLSRPGLEPMMAADHQHSTLTTGQRPLCSVSSWLSIASDDDEAVHLPRLLSPHVPRSKLQALVYDILPSRRKVPESDARSVGLIPTPLKQL